jgi:hypothetical protein
METSRIISSLETGKIEIINYCRIQYYCNSVGMTLDFNHFTKRRSYKSSLCYTHRPDYESFDYKSVRDKNGFYKYCYYINMHEHPDDIHKLILQDDQIYRSLSPEEALTIFKEEYEGYTAISACVLAQEVSTEQKRCFIKILLSYGFKPNNNDIVLANLAVYDAIPDNIKNTILSFLLNSIFFEDINWYIISLIINIYRKEHNPLCGI